MSNELTSYCCVGLICVGWPALWAFVAVNLTRYGLAGWVRRILEHAKASVPAEYGGYRDAG